MIKQPTTIKQSRIDYVLGRTFEFNGVIQTRKEWLNHHANIGTSSKIGESTRKFNRRKYNSLDPVAQKEYYDKAHNVSLQYQLLYSDTSYYALNKTEYEYYISLDKGTVENKSDLYLELLKISGIAELIEKLQNEQDEELWWTIAEKLSTLLSVDQLLIIDDRHGWNLAE